MAGYHQQNQHFCQDGMNGGSEDSFFASFYTSGIVNFPIYSDRNGFNQYNQHGVPHQDFSTSYVHNELQSAEEDEYSYVEKFRELELKKIKEVGETELGVSYNERASSSSRRSVTTEWSYGDNSILGTIPTSHPQTFQDYETIYSRYNTERRKFDSSGLAIYECKEKILSAVATHQVTIVEGFTGCGKTTQVPQFILDEAIRNNQPCRIVVTQPRRLACISVATRVCQEREWELGSLVGYQVGLCRQFTDDSRIVYMTTGVLLQTLISKKNLDEWTHIIIDEVHERDLDTDLLMLVFKTIMIDKSDTTTKVLLMSATLNADKFKSYFPKWRSRFSSITSNETYMEAVLVKVPAITTHTVTEHYVNALKGVDSDLNESFDEPKITNEVYEHAAHLIASFNESERRAEDRGAVLVFLPGLLEIETMYKVLDELAKSKEQDGRDVCNWTILPLHSSITNEEQQLCFKPVLKSYRKIILATNIAESSITVNDVKYVIDFCLTKSLSCDPQTNYTTLRLEWASKNQCIQRKGRCGRVSAGHCYRMVSKKFYESFVQEAPPEMAKSSLESVVLHAKMLDMGSPTGLLALAIDPPKKSGIRRAVANLKEVGALSIKKTDGTYDEFDGSLTYLGKIMSKLPIDMRFGRLIAMGHVFGVLEETIIIAAGLSTKSPFSYPYHRRLNAYLSKLYWSQNTFSDPFALVNVYRTWVRKFENAEFRTPHDEKMWAKSYMVQLSVLREIKNLVDEITKRLKKENITVEKSNLEITGNRGLLLKVAIAGAFYPNYFSRTRPKKTEWLREIAKDLQCQNPFTTVVYQGFPQDQPSELYAEHILKPFEGNLGSAGDGITIPYMVQMGSKILLSFDERGQKVGSICHGVYRALKMRQLRRNVTFRIVRKDEAEALLKDSYGRLSRKKIIKAPEQTILPSIIEKEVHVIIMHLVSPTEFYVIKEDDYNNMITVQESLASLSDFLRPVAVDECVKGALVFTYEGDRLERARIELLPQGNQENNMIYLFLMDLGKVVRKSCNKVYVGSIPHSDAYTIPALAIQCRLQECRPLVSCSGIWPKEALEAIKLFNSQHNSKFIFKINSIVEGIMAGELLSRDKQESLSDYLKGLRLTSYVEESKASQQNNKLRTDGYVARQDESVRARFNDEQKQTKIPAPYVRSPPDDESNSLIILRGANSPLEMNFSALCASSHMKQVIVDQASVNSVALDMDYLDPCARLLVSGSIGIAHRSGNLLSRDTTLYPSIPNLTGLLTMLFCPIMELRVNDSLTEYTGCLAGLGIDPINREPIYRDHDVEVMFDAIVDNEDINLINSIRMTMNYVLSPDNFKSLKPLKERCQAEIIQLLQKPRETIEEQWPQHPHQWNSMRPDVKRLCPGSKSDSSNGLSDVFLLHEGWLMDGGS